ncbi:MAG: hypothetical protein II997_04950 [Clostridia bacterium]|nr:hypothetical protein [Clostridia bacterium]
MNAFGVNYNQNCVVYTEIKNPWHFKAADKKVYDTSLQLFKTESKTREISFTLHSYKNNENTLFAKRVYLSADENVVFICDFIKSEKDICIYTDFVIANSDLSASCNIAEKNKLVIRNAKCAAKHFRLFSEIDGNCIMDKTGLMMPQSVTKCSDVIYSMYEGLYSFGKEHIACFGFCTDTVEKIVGWHYIKTDKGYKVEPPSKGGGWEIAMEGRYIKLYDCSDLKCVFSTEL